MFDDMFDEYIEESEEQAATNPLELSGISPELALSEVADSDLRDIAQSLLRFFVQQLHPDVSGIDSGEESKEFIQQLTDLNDQATFQVAREDFTSVHAEVVTEVQELRLESSGCIEAGNARADSLVSYFIRADDPASVLQASPYELAFVATDFIDDLSEQSVRGSRASREARIEKRAIDRNEWIDPRTLAFVVDDMIMALTIDRAVERYTERHPRRAKKYETTEDGIPESELKPFYPNLTEADIDMDLARQEARRKQVRDGITPPDEAAADSVSHRSAQSPHPESGRMEGKIRQASSRIRIDESGAIQYCAAGQREFQPVPGASVLGFLSADTSTTIDESILKPMGHVLTSKSSGRRDDMLEYSPALLASLAENGVLESVRRDGFRPAQRMKLENAAPLLQHLDPRIPSISMRDTAAMQAESVYIVVIQTSRSGTQSLSILGQLVEAHRLETLTSDT